MATFFQFLPNLLGIRKSITVHKEDLFTNKLNSSSQPSKRKMEMERPKPEPEYCEPKPKGILDVAQLRILRELRNILHFSNNDSSSADATYRRIQQEVEASPILAQVVDKDWEGSSLLSFLLMKSLNLNELFHPTIKFLIEANPSALLQETNSHTSEKVIHIISRHPLHCVLMPWIADKYQWVLDHYLRGMPTKYGPAFGLLHLYGFRSGSCDDAIIRGYFESYPRELNDDPWDALHFLLLQCQHHECSANLFKWMANKCSETIMTRQNKLSGFTLLHRACYMLTRHLGDDSMRYASISSNDVPTLFDYSGLVRIMEQSFQQSFLFIPF